ncbi:SAM-dependent methyltransferase [Shouchella patagoniensis]|uniref:SAM-dependent methyltransferase n=1 Tax=Shouchella patagoniensis TaxID=228576 RepID=UPI000995BBF7|nr:SAM-dependent methyltransferase [Shouchella patagoniensis]
MSRVENSKKLNLERIVFIGRTYEEYLNMFLLSKEELFGKKVLDCPAGACSFTAVGNKLGLDIIACDIAYYHSGNLLKSKGLQDIEHAMVHMEKAFDNYNWDFFRDIADLKSHRLSALTNCSNDMLENGEKYIPVTLPTLPFKDDQFDIVLSAHFLFMYGDRLDYQFHINTLKELLRVTKLELRIFPLVNLEGKRYEELDNIIKSLKSWGYEVTEIAVNYEFQINANSMLKVRKLTR